MLDFVENKYVIAIARVALVLIYFMGGFSLLTGSVPVEYAATKGDQIVYFFHNLYH